ncbi:MAG: prepilin peptidase [Chromatiales bacterium]
MDLLTALATNPALYLVIAGSTGLVVGSFLNVVIHRLPLMMEREWRLHYAESDSSGPPPAEPFNLWRPPSHCPACRRPIRARENIPVLSFLFQRGRCAGCGARIPRRYPVVEILAAVVATVSAWHYGFGVAAMGAASLGWALIALGCIDLDRHLLPDAITLPLLWAGLGLNLAGVYTDIEASVLGAMAGYLVLWAVYWLFKLLTGKEGMGYGDFKLLAALGAWAGWQSLPLTVLLASAVGAVTGIVLIAMKRRERSQPIPFGPLLAAAGWISLLWGDQITRAYLGGVVSG